MVAPLHNPALYFAVFSIRTIFRSISILNSNRAALEVVTVEYEVDQDLTCSILALVSRQVNRCEATWVQYLCHIKSF